MKKRLFLVLFSCIFALAAVLPVMAAGIDGTVELSSGSHVRWIDRLDLSHADAAPLLAFYNALAEGADNDGEADFLIEDHPEGYSFEVAKLTGTFTATTSGSGFMPDAYPISASFSPSITLVASSITGTFVTFVI
jgi:hypothetical protein